MKLWILGKIGLTVLAVFTLTLYVLSFYFNWRFYDILHFKQPMMEEKQVTNTTKLILFWNTMFGNKDFYMGKGDIFAKCPVNDCYATHHRDYKNLSEFDVMLFHGNELDLSDLPKNRDSRQLYAFVNLESPANRPLTNAYYEDFFNITVTYRLDSDVIWNYGVIKEVDTDKIIAPSKRPDWSVFYNRSSKRSNEREATLSKTISGKTKAVVWFVSNCVAKSGRQNYVNELSKHILVDVYGKCGSAHCPVSVDCFAKVAEPDYFFYLSFENSLCDDYVTEKLYNALRYNIVPIVYGGANYSLFAPPQSYINAFDFDTPKDLANYLKRLMKDPEEYSKYFLWKRYYKIDSGTSQVVCNLCAFLHGHKQSRTYDSLSDWYSESKCLLQGFLRYQSYVTGSVLKDKV